MTGDSEDISRRYKVTVDHLLTPNEVAGLLGVTPETIRGWAERGKLTVVLTPGGQTRYRHTEVMMHVAAMAPAARPGATNGGEPALSVSDQPPG
jgi:excisionase family DNA binding protein